MIRESFGELVHQELAPIRRNQRRHFKTHLKALVDERQGRLAARLSTIFPKLTKSAQVVEHEQPEPLMPRPWLHALVLKKSLQRGPDAECVFRIYAVEVIEDQHNPPLIVSERFFKHCVELLFKLDRRRINSPGRNRCLLGRSFVEEQTQQIRFFFDLQQQYEQRRKSEYHPRQEEDEKFPGHWPWMKR